MVLGIFRRCWQSQLAIEIGASAVKSMELVREADQMILNAVSVLPVSEGTVAPTLQALAKRGLQGREVGTLVPHCAVVSTTVTLEAATTEKALSSQVWQAVGRSFPELMDSYCLDYQILGMHQQDPTLMDVFVVACPKTVVQTPIQALEVSGFTVSTVDVDAYALQRALPLCGIDEGGVVVVMNLNETDATLIVLSEGDLVYSHSEPVTWHGSGDVDVAAHVPLWLQSFYETTGYQQVDRVVISGDLASMTGLLPALQAQISAAIHIANPFHTLRIAPEVDATQAITLAPSFLACAGVALRAVADA